MAPLYKLYYFDLKAAAEPIRYLLSYGGVEFEDVRVPREEWPQLKPQMPFGKVPVLEVDGKKAHQSTSICRYLAKQFDLAGSTDWENVEIDATVDTIADLRSAIGAARLADEETKEKKMEILLTETFPYYSQRLNEQVEKNGGYLVGGKLTWADLYFSATLETANAVLNKDLTAGYPHLKALSEKVWALPKIEEWRSRRPVTEM